MDRPNRVGGPAKTLGYNFVWPANSELLCWEGVLDKLGVRRINLLIVLLLHVVRHDHFPDDFSG
jgi:hypothetical protein